MDIMHYGISKKCKLPCSIKKHPLPINHDFILEIDLALHPKKVFLQQMIDIYQKWQNKMKQFNKLIRKIFQQSYIHHLQSLQQLFFKQVLNDRDFSKEEQIQLKKTIKSLSASKFDDIRCCDMELIMSSLRQQKRSKLPVFKLQFLKMIDRMKDMLDEQIRKQKIGMSGQNDLSEIHQLNNESEFVDLRELQRELECDKKEKMEIYEKKQEKKKQISESDEENYQNFYSMTPGSSISDSKQQDEQIRKIMEKKEKILVQKEKDKKNYQKMKMMKHENHGLKTKAKNKKIYFEKEKSEDIQAREDSDLQYEDPQYGCKMFIRVAKLKEEVYKSGEKKFNIQLKVVKQLSFKIMHEAKKDKNKMKFIGGDSTGVVVCFTNYLEIPIEETTVVLFDCTLKKCLGSFEISSWNIKQMEIGCLKKVNKKQMISSLCKNMNYKIMGRDHHWPGIYGIGCLNDWKQKKEYVGGLNLIVEIETVACFNETENIGLCRDGCASINFEFKQKDISLKVGSTYLFENVTAHYNHKYKTLQLLNMIKGQIIPIRVSMVNMQYRPIPVNHINQMINF